MKKFFEKKSHRAESTLREYPLASLSFLDDVKILLRKLSENCKKSGPFRVRLSAEKKLPTVIVGLFSSREKAPTKNIQSVICSKTFRFFQQTFESIINRLETVVLSMNFTN